MKTTRGVRPRPRRIVRRSTIPILTSLQVLIVLLVGGAIGLGTMATFYSESNKYDISHLKQQYPITKYNDLRKPTPFIPPDRPPCTNINTCR